MTDDDEVARLNAAYRGIPETTDVLSFAMQEGPGAGVHPGLLGDVVISVERAARQAHRRGRQTRAEATEGEIVRLLVHGFCHLRGMTHGARAQAREMAAEEARLLGQVGHGT